MITVRVRTGRSGSENTVGHRTPCCSLAGNLEAGPAAGRAFRQ